MNIVINRTDAIGDTLLTMPMAKLLKIKFPSCKIAFIVAPKCADLFKNHPYVDECWVLNPKDSFYKKMSYLSQKFIEFTADCFIHVGGSHIPSLQACLKRVALRAGLKSKWQSFIFLNKAVRQSRSLVSMHESDYNLNLLSSLDIIYKSSERIGLAPEIFISKTDRSKSFELYKKDLAEAGIEYRSETIVIHPGMTGHTLNWSSRNYARLISKLEREQPGRFNFVISFTPGDENFLTGLRSQLEKEEYKFVKKIVHFFDGSKRGLSDYMAFLSGVDLFIGPSTGTTHIANTLGVKMIGIYSPIRVQSVLRWGPFKRNEQTKIIVPDVVCGEQFDCAGKICPYYECMLKIEIEDVYTAACKLTAV